MKQEDKELVLKYLCMALPYGVKIMVEGWDSDSGCEFTTIETLIGIDDRFIHTIWDKTGDKDKHSIIEPLSILDYKPYLCPMSSMTDDEKETYYNLCYEEESEEFEFGKWAGRLHYHDTIDSIDWLNAHHFDYRGLIEKGIAIEVTDKNNPYKN